MMTTKETVLDVVGMSCASCVRHVEQALRKVAGVERVEVMLKDAQARVHHAANVDVAQMVSAVEEAGYESRVHGGAS